MMIMRYKYYNGATPLDPVELHDLIPEHLATQEELNAWEEKNIQKARQWASNKIDILSISFIRELHRQMFDETWRWAGRFRTTERNFGVNWLVIPADVKKLCDDVLFQLAHATFPDDEIAVRLHHRLVWIHPFPNGNGRHARFMADLLIIQLGHLPFSWGLFQELSSPTPVRKNYIDSLQLADRGDFSKLLIFARS
jgi:Fic-DOC domain mobile mystery protein B